MTSCTSSPRRRQRIHALSLGAVVAGLCVTLVGGGAAAASQPAAEAARVGGWEQASPGDGSPSSAPGEQESPADLIPLTPLSGVTSLNATVTLNANGTMNGKPKQGDLTAELATSSQATSRIDVTGSLLGDVVTEVGGSAIKLFRPSKVSVYTVPEGTYVVVSSLFDLCVKPQDSAATEAMSQLSPEGLMSILTSPGVARGTFVADETLDGLAVRHYRMSGAAFLSAAQASSDPTVSAFASSLRSVSDGDLYVASDGGYPVAYRGALSGAFEPLAFDGDLSVAIDLTAVNAETEVSLPPACDHPISQ